MLDNEKDVLHFEMLAEMQQIDDDSHNAFLSLLVGISDKLKAGKSIQEIKRDINKANINENLDDTLQTMMNEQVSNITGEETKVSLSKEALAGYTFSEAIRDKKLSTKKQAIRFMAQARELIKDNQDTKELIKNEVEKYKRQLESFYRTQTKKARETGYDKVDKKLSKKVRGWISVAVLDNRTSAICSALHNKFYPKKEYKTRFNVPHQPPRHPNCRSVLLTVFEGTRITDYKGQKIETFLKQNPKIAESILGKKKYRIFMSGKAKITSFVDIKGKRWFRNDEIIKRLGIKNPKRLKIIEGE